MEVEDEILEEVDVYLNKSISPNLHIFQYWSQSSPIAERTDCEVRARPNYKLFEIETQLDTKSRNFDERKSELFGRYLEEIELKSDSSSSKNSSQRSSGSTRLTKQILKSTELKPRLGQYCVAVLRSDCQELHINPIQSVIQFKPKLNYLDNKTPEMSSNKSKAGSKGEESDGGLSSQDEADIQTITMRFAGPDEEKFRKARERSFAYFQQKLAKDHWISVNCHPIDSDLSSDKRMSLIYSSPQSHDNSDEDLV